MGFILYQIAFHIGSLFISDRPSVHMMTLLSDTLCIVFAESNHSFVKVEYNHIGSLLSLCECMNPIRFQSGTSVSKRQLRFRVFKNSLALFLRHKMTVDRS